MDICAASVPLELQRSHAIMLVRSSAAPTSSFYTAGGGGGGRRFAKTTVQWSDKAISRVVSSVLSNDGSATLARVGPGGHPHNHHQLDSHTHASSSPVPDPSPDAALAPHMGAAVGGGAVANNSVHITADDGPLHWHYCGHVDNRRHVAHLDIGRGGALRGRLLGLRGARHSRNAAGSSEAQAKASS
jgi:hypothetical protein